MGISCQINTFRPSDAWYHPTQEVSGVIKYSVDQPKEVLKITTSLKGVGKVILKHKSGNRENTYKTKETYLNIETVIQNKKTVIPVGSYEVKFNYTLPQKLPSTMKFKKKFNSHKVKCYIEYYICMNFEKGLFSFDKHYRKEILVMSPVQATLLREPVTYEVRKKLFQFSPFSKGDSVVIISATIVDSVLPICGQIVVHYAVANKSHVTIEMIKTRLVEAHTFKAKGHSKVTDLETVEGTMTEQVVNLGRGDTRNISLEMNVPRYIYSLENAVIATRNYFIRIIATLPFPHKDAVLTIPVQIGIHGPNGLPLINSRDPGPSVSSGGAGPSVSLGDPGPSVSSGGPPPLTNVGDPPPSVNFDDPPPVVNFDGPAPSVNADDPPPSYWEVMGEMNDNEDASDDEPLIT